MPRSRILTGLVLAFSISAALSLSPAMSRAVTVSLLPSDTTVTVGDTFTIRAVTTAFPDLKAFELIYQYDPVHLQLLGATAGDVLTSSGGYSDFLRPDYASPADSIWYDAAVLVGSSSGPGILAFFTLKALTEGKGSIDCRLVDFRDSQNNRTLPDCQGSLIHIIGPTPTRVTSWGRIKTLYK